MPLSLDNDKYLEPPEVEEEEYKVDVYFTVVYSLNTAVSATSKDQAEELVKHMERDLLKKAMAKNEIVSTELEIDYIQMPDE